VRWTESELGGVNAADLRDPEPVRWTSFDGREITGFLYGRPPGSRVGDP
jgi:dipeptidyl aminopeptidase/acylaminoacyl peptidase